MKKKIVTVFLFLLAAALSATAVFAATDTEKQQLLAVLGIMNGDENGNLNLDRDVSRAEFSKMLVCASSYKDNVPSNSISTGFSDVPASHWASPYIRVASANKWIYGYSDGTFHPSEKIKLEEAATMLLRVLGYASGDVTGVYPQGQLALYESLDLDEGVSAAKGESVTRNDCVSMFANLMNAKTKTGQVYAQTLGHTLGSDGKIDIYRAVSDSLKGPFVIETGIEDIGIDVSGMTFYRGDRKSSADEIEKYDVVYYSPELNTVWAYTDTVTGTYSARILSDNIPQSVTVGTKNYTFESSDAARSMSVYGEFAVDDAVTLLLGREGGIVRVLSAAEYYSYDKDGYLDTVNNTLDGPYIVTDSYSSLGFPTTGVKVIRNNKDSSVSEIKKYDVVYYSAVAKTVMVYSKSISGTYTAAQPNADNPSAITVAGGTYSINDADVALSVSNMGEYRVGSLVTLLLGRNDEVAAVMSMSDYARDVYGIVTGISQKTYTDENGLTYSARTVDVMSTAGDTVSVKSTASGIAVGEIVKVEYSDDVGIKKLKSCSVTGTVTDDGVGSYKFAGDVNIIETDSDGSNPRTVFFSRLTGAKLTDSNVRYYRADSDGKITDLILSDFSGDAYIYGIMTGVSSASGFVSDEEDYDYSEVSNTNYVYEYQIGTKAYIVTSLEGYPVREGVCAVKSSGGLIESIENITELKNASLYTPFGALAGGELYLYADDVTVYTTNAYKRVNLKYSTMTLSELMENIDLYNIKAYYDKAPENGGRIRVITAYEK